MIKETHNNNNVFFLDNCFIKHGFSKLRIRSVVDLKLFQKYFYEKKTSYIVFSYEEYMPLFLIEISS